MTDYYREYNPLMLDQWTFVATQAPQKFNDISYVNGRFWETKEEAVEWCAQQMTCRWSFGSWRDDEHKCFQRGFFFREANQAMMFKLAWGGY
jgi:hypothetical protein